MATSERGDIQINSIDYRIDLQSYRELDIIDFSPRASVAGNSIVHNELLLYQPLLQTDWKHGYGFHWYADASGYQKTGGRIDTRHDGFAMLFTDSLSSDTDNDIKEGFTVFGGTLFSWGAGGVRRWTASTDTWSDLDGAVAVNYAFPSNSYLFYCRDGGQIRAYNGSTIAVTGIGTIAADYKWLIAHQGYIYAGEDGNSFVHYDSNVDLSALEGGGTVDPNVIIVGSDGWPTIGAIVYSGELFISRYDGLWQYSPEDNIARRVLDFADQISSTNFRSMAVHNGFLVFPIRDKIFQWNGVRMSDITPPPLGDTFPFTTYGRFDNFVTAGRFLFCTARTNNSSYLESLLCFDGVGWHILVDQLNSTAGSGTITAMSYDVASNSLWYHEDHATADVTKQIYFQDLSEFPYSRFPTSGDHYLVTSRLDMGYRRVKKSTPSLLVRGSNLAKNSTDADRYITVYYRTDGQSYGSELLTNTDFETDMSDWTATNYPGAAVSAAFAHGGTQSLELLSSATSVNAYLKSDTYQTAEPGDIFKASAWIRATSGGIYAVPAGIMRIGVEFYDSSNNSLNSGYYTIIDTVNEPQKKTILVDGTWVYVEYITGPAPPFAAKARFYLHQWNRASNERIYLDDASLTKAVAWTPWGGTDGTTNVVSSDGVTELTDPLGTTDSTLEYYYLELKFQFQTSVTSQTPVLEDYTVRFLMRPDTLYGFRFSIVGSSHADWGGALDERTAYTVYQNLKTARDSKAPISYTNPYGDTYQVYVTSVQMQAIERHGIVQEGGQPDIEHRVLVNLVQVG